MSWSKIISTVAVIIFVLTIVTINCAVAGEKVKVKTHAATFSGKIEPVEVGDEEGHVLFTYKAEQIYFNENTGERLHGPFVNFMDINMKTGQGFLQGYGSTIDKDGDKIFRTHKGNPVGKGHWKGTWIYVKGTGKYEGIKGEGTWESFSLSPDKSYVEIEGEVEMP